MCASLEHGYVEVHAYARNSKLCCVQVGMSVSHVKINFSQLAIEHAECCCLANVMKHLKYGLA